MKKNIIIASLGLLSTLLLMFGFDQHTEVMEKNKMMQRLERDLQEAVEMASKQQEEAVKHMKMAEMSAAEAMRQQQIAEESLKKCKGK